MPLQLMRGSLPEPTMDYHHFVRSRIKFIRRFYSDAAEPFVVRRRKIEAYEEPYRAPDGYEDAEPPFLDEWVDAGDSLDVLGQAAISMLSTSLQLFIQEWVTDLVERAGTKQLNDLGIGQPTDASYKAAFKGGWINGYRAYFARLGVDWSSGPSALTLLEDIVLARNAVQHTDDITSVRVKQAKYGGAKQPSSYFADSVHLALFDRSSTGASIHPVRLEISQDRLFAALDQVTVFCEWLDTRHPLR